MYHYRLLFVFLLAVVAAGAFLWLPADRYARITLTDPASDRLILATVMREGEEASYTWTNSIFRIPVREVFILQDGNLTLRKILSGAVQEGDAPAVSADQVQELYHPGDVFFTDDMNRPFRQIVFRVGEVGRPYFEVGKERVDFKDEVGFGGRIILDVGAVRGYEVLLSRGVPP